MQKGKKRNKGKVRWEEKVDRGRNEDLIRPKRVYGN